MLILDEMRKAIQGGDCVGYFRNFSATYTRHRNEFDSVVNSLAPTMQMGFRIIVGLVQAEQYEAACTIMAMVPLNNFK